MDFKELFLWLLAIMAGVFVFWASAAALDTDESPWLNHRNTAVKRIGDIPSTKHESGVFENIDCTEMDYTEPESGIRSTA